MKTGKPLAHWGSMPGLITDIAMMVKGKDLISCDPMDTVTISFYVPHIEQINYEHLSAAISIKSTEGIDLIVKTTYEEKIVLSDNSRKGHRFYFSFQPRLTNGDYYLVLALENHEQAVTTYYEYIEGAKYFKVYQKKEIYGQFIPNIEILIEGEKDGED